MGKAMDITTIPMEELERDLDECVNDLYLCRLVLCDGYGISGKDLELRVAVNERVRAAIGKEIYRRLGVAT